MVSNGLVGDARADVGWGRRSQLHVRDMSTITPIEDADHEGPRPYRVSVNGEILRTSNGSARRFKDSFSAALAGAKEVDRRRASVRTT